MKRVIEIPFDEPVLYFKHPLHGVMPLPIREIKHKEDGYTFIRNRSIDYSWIKTSDLYETEEVAANSNIATFYRGGN